MDVDPLVQVVGGAGRRARCRFFVVRSAGTAATEAVDPLPQIAEVCRGHDLWFHVDGCHGAPARPTDLAGMADADSLAVDAHKCLYVPLEAGCTLVRDARWLTKAFATNPSYYAMDHASDGEAVVDYYAMDMQNSRDFRALKVWLTLKQMGRDGYRQAITGNIAHARLMFDALREADDFEVGTC